MRITKRDTKREDRFVIETKGKLAGKRQSSPWVLQGPETKIGGEVVQASHSEQQGTSDEHIKKGGIRGNPRRPQKGERRGSREGQ